ncbi:MAG: LysE family translocator [Sphingomonas sp.]|uniref:LysE family translocator n=1 Tax=Sphingomonas sp. TaxID=28214 RepID=UPI001B27C933|nr:LysE family translocator [Sphingomonas sp.]MBO9621553.1 LysE family translocator [Sphingomonas sp.]
MNIETLLVFVPACFALNLALGPNNLMSITIAAHHGARRAIAASAGRIVAFAAMIGVAALGLGAVLAASDLVFSAIKWTGALYLFWLGARLLLYKGEAIGPHAGAPSRPAPQYARREFLVAAGNPKAILIFTSFLPQFVSVEDYWQDFFVLGAMFLALEVAAVTIYALVGSRLQQRVRDRTMARRVNRTSGVAMITLAGALLFADRRT